jgi:hypothetical protein
MTAIFLKLLSWLLKKVLYWPFYWYSCYMAYKRGGKEELKDFILECSIMDDVDLNQVGKYPLNDYMHTGGPEAGNRFQTVSCWLGLTNPNKRVTWWVKWLDKRDPNHCLKAVEFHKRRVLREAQALGLIK